MRSHTYVFIMSLFHSLPNYGFRISPAHADSVYDHSNSWDVQSCHNYCNSLWGRVPLLNKQWTRGACYNSNCVCEFNHTELGQYMEECVQESVFSSVGSKKTKADRAIQVQVGRLDTRQRFEIFKEAYGKKYSSSEEEKRRFKIFADNLVKIDKLMAKRKGNVVYGVGPFTDLTSGEYMASIGVIRRRGGSTRTARLQPRMLSPDDRSRRRRSSAPPTLSPELSQQSSHRERGNSVPPSYRISLFQTLHYFGRDPEGSPLIDWRAVPVNLYPPTEAQVCDRPRAELLLERKEVYVGFNLRNKLLDKNQFGRKCGACYAFAAVGAVEILLARAEGRLTLLSKQSLIDCDPENGGCNGGLIENSLRYIQNFGIPTSGAYPYKAETGNCQTHIRPFAQIADFIRADSSKLEEHLKFSPIPTNMHAQEELQFYVSGVYESDDCPNDPEHLNHAVVIVGHYRDAWILRDSVPSSYGLQGHFLMQKGICGIGSPETMSYEINNPYRPKKRKNASESP